MIKHRHMKITGSLFACGMWRHLYRLYIVDCNNVLRYFEQETLMWMICLFSLRKCVNSLTSLFHDPINLEKENFSKR